jgi:hypothetical protein
MQELHAWHNILILDMIQFQHNHEIQGGYMDFDS